MQTNWLQNPILLQKAIRACLFLSAGTPVKNISYSKLIRIEARFPDKSTHCATYPGLRLNRKTAKAIRDTTARPDLLRIEPSIPRNANKPEQTYMTVVSDLAQKRTVSVHLSASRIGDLFFRRTRMRLIIKTRRKPIRGPHILGSLEKAAQLFSV